MYKNYCAKISIAIIITASGELCAKPGTITSRIQRDGDATARPVQRVTQHGSTPAAGSLVQPDRPAVLREVGGLH